MGNQKNEKKKRTIEQKRRSGAISIVVSLIILVSFAIVTSSLSGASQVSATQLLSRADASYSPVDYSDVTDRVIPYMEDGYWTFDEPSSGRPLKILHLTDVHIGGGFASNQKDIWAMNAVATMVTVEKPDLVIITGDIAYPFYFQAGTVNNINAIEIFGNLMTKLGVYWTFVFGNHDTESYSTHSREEVCEFIENEQRTRKDTYGKYCLFQRGPKEIDGYGNQFIIVKNEKDIITQALCLIDSHAYLDDDIIGMLWHYDSIHVNQQEWFNSEMARLEKRNQETKKVWDNTHSEPIMLEPIFGSMFIHIPIEEYREAYELCGNVNHEPGYVDETGRVEILGGKVGKRHPYCFSGKNGCNTFENCVPHGLRALFCGHDHYNNIMMSYQKEINYGTQEQPDIRMSEKVMLCYAPSIDYLASPGIWQLREQRGCNVIYVKGSKMTPHGKNYYSDEYKEMRDSTGGDNATKANKYED